jgi:NOL1/NOP2/sun family putative RNA methylase
MFGLPESFISRIRSQLGPEADAFFQCYGEPRAYGFRVNPLKLGADFDQHPVFREKLEPAFGLERVPWCRDGFYCSEDAQPGKHAYHQAGLYYIQEPSAMSSAELLDVKPGEAVLDLAAAPGGKSTQMAARLMGSGLLVANEIHPARAKILSENIERFGVQNAVVTNETPGKLAGRFADAFDKIMLDAPCSGEGMFRKDPETIKEWSPEHVALCAARQADILRDASAMLKPGGMLAYSTCTFNREENEETVERFLAEHPDFSLVRTERIWPHRQRGEGHFVALLRKLDEQQGDTPGGKTFGAALASGGAPGSVRAGRKSGAAKDKSAAEAMRLAEKMLQDAVPGFRLPDGEPVLFGEQLYWLPRAASLPLAGSDLRGLKALRPGLHLAHVRKDRAEPAHALALAAAPETFRRLVNLAADDPALAAYLRGETIAAPAGMSGWCAVAVDGFPLGWAKASGGQLKNHYPKGLRRNV